MGEKIFVDANIFLEVLLMDSKSAGCKSFLEYTPKEDIITSDFIIYSCCLVVEKKARRSDDLDKAITFLHSLDLTIMHPSADELSDALKFMKRYSLDFDDSFIIACMQRYNISKLATLDEHFTKVKEIECIVP